MEDPEETENGDVLANGSEMKGMKRLGALNSKRGNLRSVSQL